MTTQNTQGTLTNRIILSASFDHSSDEVDQPGSPNEVLKLKHSISYVTKKSSPDHWQDQVSDGIMIRTLGNAEDSAGEIITPERIATSLRPGNEFELDVETLTHTWQTVSTVTPLPGLAQTGDGEGSLNSAQIKALHIDLGMMREIISVQGILYDADTHPSSTSGHHIRRQQLLDIARTQWANVHNFNRENSFEWNNVNKYPALTIGPMHGRSTTGIDRDLGYYGDEPSNDVRGSQVKWVDSGIPLTPTGVGLVAGSIRNQYGNYSWDYTFTYQGRRRYRGIIRRLTLTALAGQPNIWRFNFDFEIIKNELELRMMAEGEKESSSDEGGFINWIKRSWAKAGGTALDLE